MKKENIKLTVRAFAPSVRPTSKARQNKGITLIALVITVIVMLILVAVTISMAINGGLFDYAGKATSETENAIEKEQELANGKVQIDGTWYNSIDDYLNNKPMFDAEAWDEDAAPEDVFIWQSDDPNDEGYGVVVGYTANIDNYPTLRYPSRCTKITVDNSYITGTTDEMAEIRSYTSNIKEVEIPSTVLEIASSAFDTYGLESYRFDSLQKVTIKEGVKSIGSSAFKGCSNLVTIEIPESTEKIGWFTFSGCTSLTSVVIPDTVKSIEYGAFYGVQHIYYNGTATGSPWGASAIN